MRGRVTAGRVIVVGSGVVGAGAAYELVRRGVAVTVVEAGRDGAATAAGAGIVAPGASVRASEAYASLSYAAAAHYPELLASLREDGQDTSWYSVCGALFVAADEAEAARLDEVHAAFVAHVAAGAPNMGAIARLGGGEARALFPPLGDVPGAIHVAGAARLDGRSLRAALLDAAVRRGARVVTGEARPEMSGGRVTGVWAGGERLSADAVILAAGAWSAAFARAAGVEVGVYPQRGQILHVDMPGADTAAWPVLVGFHSHYMVAFPEHRLVAGATREDGPGFDARVTAGGMAEVLDQLLRLAPGAADGTLLEFRVGLRPATPDHLPVLGPAPGAPGLFLATGHGANGLTAGAYSGRLVARQAIGEHPEMDLRPYAVERFAR
jgi:D-amino-acid dehydrogenase